MEPEYCPTCGDIMEPDDVTGEVRCMTEHIPKGVPMPLITDAKDERLSPDSITDWEALLLASLRAALAAKEKAEGALCRAREALVNDGGRYGKGTIWCVVDTLRQATVIDDPACPKDREVFNERLNCAADRIDATLSSTAPCPHEAELKVARETVAGQEAEIREGDYWQERARESFANGTCPCCFCTDEGPHEKGCAWAEHEEKLQPEAVEDFIRSLSWSPDTPSIHKTLVAGNIRHFAVELRRAAGREGEK